MYKFGTTIGFLALPRSQVRGNKVPSRYKVRHNHRITNPLVEVFLYVTCELSFISIFRYTYFDLQSNPLVPIRCLPI